MRRWSALAAVLLIGAGFLLPQHREPESPQIRFEDMAAHAGVRFVLENSPTTRKHLIESMAGGVAVFDYDGDGRPDIFFTNGASLPALRKDSAKFYNRLFRNEGGWRFTDVTGRAGVAGEGYSMGAAAGDFDNDGRVDLFVAGVSHNILYRNLGGGKFADVTARAGIKSDKWSVAAGWFDYDNDGLLDLLVVNYAKWSPEFDRFCGDQEKNIRVYCHPKYFEGLPPTLYHNRGDGTFEDVSERSGIARHAGRGMSVAFADYDGDGLIDFFITNDNEPNFLFHNLGNGRFEEVALLAGVALLDHGKPVASMGADFRDFDNDGLPDISVTALFHETFPLFRNIGRGMFQDVTYSSKLGPLSARKSGWGNALVDLNADGWKDLFVAASHVNDRVELFEPTQYKLANSVYTNAGDGTFRENDAGMERSIRAHRGSAFGDLDGDGKIDVVVSALGEPAELWRNITPGANHWIKLKLTGNRSNRDGIGTAVRIGNQVNAMTSSVGYASSSLDGVYFGLGPQSKAENIEILWPGGRRQVIKDVEADRVIEIKEPAQ